VQAYVKKDGDFIASFSVEDAREKKAKLNKDTLDMNTREAVQTGTISWTQAKAHNQARQLMDAPTKEAEELESTCGVWVLGPKGVGKSHYVRNTCGYTREQILNKNINKWYDDWTSVHKVVLLDDLDTSHVHLGHYLKQWADKYPFQAEVKGSTKFSIRPEKIIVTSNYTPEQIWDKDSKMADAIKDRFELVNMTNFPRRRDNKNLEKWNNFKVSQDHPNQYMRAFFAENPPYQPEEVNPP